LILAERPIGVFAGSETLIEEGLGTGGREETGSTVMRRILKESRSRSCRTANIRGGGVDVVSLQKDIQDCCPYHLVQPPSIIILARR